ncbi:S8/S53 family peptidase [Ferruginibacter albus]|uniref:S8/S53 family peptidase n=1 Tax=Ferruginibacter albus TaxID=2875540 RepID=UPI001CC5BD6E|nr:S8/S53 family peptidase [Ferruginibacter albus]UAY51721.1 S8 family peptidase [Ferruginibacter albus]
MAQFSRYVIQLKDKAGTPFTLNDPSQFLTQRAIDRRSQHNIIIDSVDLPVTPAYLDSIRLSGNVTIVNISKWLNTVCIQTTDANALAKINTFTFVVSSNTIAMRPAAVVTPEVNRPTSPEGITGDSSYYGAAFGQIHLHNGEFLHNHGFKGNGMIITMTDDGFYNFNTLPSFDSARYNNQILGTWDFVSRDTLVSDDDAHGMQCFSTIASNMPGTFVGTAPGSNYYLYKTEDLNSEYPVELYNWINAAEKADSLGADVISVSLGYNTFDNNLGSYTYADLDGKSTIIDKGINIAARKGILVVAAAGNSGGDAWHYIDTPGDADSALSVGAVDINRQPAYFSGYGPNSAGQTKPDVAAVGVNAIVESPYTGQPSYDGGTSFSCPIIAGLSTCLWQAFPEISNMQIIDALHKASDRYTDPDNRTGYGIPDFKKAFVQLIQQLHTQQIVADNNRPSINWMVKSAADMNVIVERKLSSDANYIAIGTLNKATSFTVNDFSFTDDLSGLPSQSISYRVKMTIAADTSFYLDSTVVTHLDTSAVVYTDSISIYPNPAVNDLKVFISQKNASNIQITVCNSAGQLIYTYNENQPKGSKIYTIPFQKLNSGVYFVTLYADNKKKITKQVIHLL